MVRYMAAVLYHQKTKPPSAGQHIGATGNRIFQDMCAEVSLRDYSLDLADHALTSAACCSPRFGLGH